MGWYGASQFGECERANNGQPCTKKQWCGTGKCLPWPYYCWMPGSSGGGGGGGDTPPEEEPAAGKTCAEMGWFAAEEFEACNEASSTGSCIKKQWCDTGTCEPWPHYCWKTPN